MKISTLRTYAREAAKFRGHVMTKFEGGLNRQSSYCILCNMHMYVVSDPLPNDIFVSGEAVALCCSLKNKEDK